MNEQSTDMLSMNDLNPDKSVQLAIYARNLVLSYSLSYSSELALNGANISVPTGCIYGLLGPSGAGKTSILRCVSGFMSPKGEISVFGYRPGDIGGGIPGPGLGYMPQDVCLHDDLTIEETLLYFGGLNLMNKHTIHGGIDYICDFLGLPPKKRLVGTLSGGEKRRTSLASALIHKPRLLLLDEPTVGVDPLLRVKIWEKLIELSTSGQVTIIITTHYIEEARKANMIGLMRKGKILVEDEPENLISKYQAVTLEDVFYKVVLRLVKKKTGDTTGYEKIKDNDHEHCQAQNKVYCDTVDATIAVRKVPLKIDQTRGTYKDWWSVFWVVFWKKMIQQLRHPDSLVVLVLMPVINLMLICVCLGSTPHSVPLAIFNEEDPPYLSQIFIDQINTYILKLTNFSSFNEAMDTVRTGENWGLLHIKENFSDSLIDRFIYFEDMDNETVAQSIMKIHGDMTSYMLQKTVELTLDFALSDFMSQALLEEGKTPYKHGPPVKISPVAGEFEPTDLFGIRNFYVPGIIVMLAYGVSFSMTFVNFFSEKADLMFERNHVAGVTPIQIVFSHLAARFIPVAIKSLLLMCIAMFFFNVPCEGSFILAATVVFLLAIVGMVQGMVLSIVLDSFYLATSLAIGYINVIFAISGVIWVRDALPYWLGWLGLLQPPALPTDALRAILIAGNSITDPKVYWSFVISAVYIIIFTSLVHVTMKYRR